MWATIRTGLRWNTGVCMRCKIRICEPTEVQRVLGIYADLFGVTQRLNSGSPSG